jgi:hypothetical protein
LAPGNGFTVSDGQITGASWVGISPHSEGIILNFQTCGLASNQTPCGNGNGGFIEYPNPNYLMGRMIYSNVGTFGGTASFAPSIRNGPLTASAPGPLPLLGLAAAFKTSRNVRHRLRSRLG